MIVDRAYIATAGDLKRYVEEVLPKLGKAGLEARIAKLKAKISKLKRAISTGKFAKAGKPGPKNARQAKWALGGCERTLGWCQDALKHVGVATASAETADAYYSRIGAFRSNLVKLAHEIGTSNSMDRHLDLLDDLYEACLPHAKLRAAFKIPDAAAKDHH